MAFDAGAILGWVGLDLSDYARGILEAQSISAVFPQMVTEFLESPLLGFIQISKEATEAIKEMILDVSEGQHAVAQSAEALGVSVEFLDGWRKSAERLGVQADEVSQALTFMQRSAFAAAKDGADPAAAAYAKLGITVTDAGGKIKATDQLAREVADAMSHLQGGVERTGLAMEIFGRGGAAAISFFAQGSRSIDAYSDKLRQMGDLTTEENAKQAAAFEGLLSDINHVWEGIQAQLAEPLREELTPMLNGILNWVNQHPAEIKDIIRETAQAIIEVLREVASVARFLGEHFHELEIVLGAAGIGAAAAISISALNLIGDTLIALVPKIEAATVAQIALNQAEAAGAVGLGGAGKGLLGRAAGGAALGYMAHPNISGAIGGAVGGEAGAYGGAAIGTFIAPGIGTAIGGALGYIGGALGGGYGAGYLQDKWKYAHDHPTYIDGDTGKEVPANQLDKYDVNGRHPPVNITVNAHSNDARSLPKIAGGEVEKALKKHLSDQNVRRQVTGRAQ